MYALRISGNDALELGYRAVFRRILGVVLQHDVRNLRIARLENHLRAIPRELLDRIGAASLGIARFEPLDKQHLPFKIAAASSKSL